MRGFIGGLYLRCCFAAVAHRVEIVRRALDCDHEE